jgi:hypothetical protein
MGHCLVNFQFKCLVPSLEFRKVRFDRHMACLRVRQSPSNQTRPNATPTMSAAYPFSGFPKIPIVHESALREPHAGLPGINQNAIIQRTLAARPRRTRNQGGDDRR